MARELQDRPGHEYDNEWRPGEYDGQTTPAGNPSDPRGAYDRQKTPLGDSSDPRGDSLANAESNPKSRQDNAADQEASNLTDKLGKGYTDGSNTIPGGRGSDKKSLRERLSKITKKRAAVGIVTVLLGSGGIFGGFTILQGPASVIQLSEVLQKNFYGEENSSSVRASALIRFAKTGDIGEARVTKVGSKVFEKTIPRLQDIGIEFDRNRLAGNIRSATIDTSKLSKRYPELRNMSPEEKRTFVARTLDVPENSLSSNGDRINVNTRDFGIKATRSLLSSSLGVLDDGKIVTGVKMRTLAKFYNVPSLFHPIKRTVASQENRLSNKEERRQAEKERREALKAEAPEEVKSAKSRLKDKLRGNQSKIGAALLGTSAMCIIRDVAGDVVLVNRGEIVDPAIVETYDKIAAGAQGKAGMDVTLAQYGAIAESFIDENGKSIWESQPLKATADPTKPATGKDISPDYKQAFSKDTTQQGILGTIGNGGVSDIVCSDIGQVVQFVGGLALIAAGPFTGGATWGAFAAKTGASAAATAGVIYMLQQQFTKLMADDTTLPETFAGPEGGSLYAYAAREGANVSARASGGIALSEAESMALDFQQEQEEQREFKSKNYFARLFDPYDYRSLISRTVQNSGATGSVNDLRNVASGLMNLPKFLASAASSITSLFSSSVFAQEELYNWSDVPRYGIPKEILNDPELQDPYDNAEKVVALLKTESGQDYIDKANKCFGVEISDSGDGWDAQAVDDINPNAQEYIDANCSDISDYNWRRIILFVFDTRTMKAVACFEGDDQSCSDIGAAPQQDSSSSANGQSPTTQANAELDMANLYEPSVDIACADGTKDLGIQDGYTSGTKVRVRVCAVQSVPETGDLSDISGANGKLVVNSRLSAFYVKLVEDAKSAGVTGITAQEGFRTMARQTCLYEGRCGPTGSVAAPGTSNHQMGLAIDWSNSMIAYLNSNPHGLKALVGGEPWHWSPTGN